jgi:signal-transduction protein with cAMP-binding, CBS, and nucleotidyltransferase domain
MEEVLDYTKEKYLALTNQLTIGVFKTSPDNTARFTEVNPALKNILGVNNDEELLAASLFDFFADQSVSDSVMDSLSRNGYIKNKVVQLKKNSRITVTVSLSAVLVKDIHHKLISIDGIIEDISEQFRTDKDKEKLIFDLQTSVHTLSQRVGGFVKKLYSCTHTAPINVAIKTMTSNDCNALLVIGSQGEEMGFITDRDLRERVFSLSTSLEEPVYTVMSSPIYSISSSSTIYEALVKYRKNKIRKLVVKNSDNTVAGYLSIDDIFEASYTNFLFFIQNIENADQINKIAEYRDQLLILVRSLIEYDINIHSITNFITLISDTITKRIIELAKNEIGEPPVIFAFITMGSEGREEQTLATDQDNAIIYTDVSPENEPDVKKYFNLLGEKICDNLAAVGYQHCKGNIMAKNAKWCQPFSVWKRYFTNWVTTSSPQDLLDIKIFFDFRHVYGDEELTTQLQNHIQHLTASYDTFFIYLAESMLGVTIPENMQKIKNPIDIKLLLLPLVDFARLYSLKYKTIETNTFRRLEAIMDKGILTISAFKSSSFCYNYLMQARLKRQIDCFDSNIQIDNLVNPTHLTEIDVALLKNYFDVLEALRNKIRMDFKGTKI